MLNCTRTIGSNGVFILDNICSELENQPINKIFLMIVAFLALTLVVLAIAILVIVKRKNKFKRNVKSIIDEAQYDTDYNASTIGSLKQKKFTVNDCICQVDYCDIKTYAVYGCKLPILDRQLSDFLVSKIPSNTPYNIIYFDSARMQRIPIKCIERFYKWIPESYRKNIQRFDIVHPTFTIRSLFPILKLLEISSRKMKMIYSLKQLDATIPMNFFNGTIPTEVFNADNELIENRNYLLVPYQHLGIFPHELQQRDNGQLVLFNACIDFIIKFGLKTENIFRLNAEKKIVNQIIYDFETTKTLNLVSADDVIPATSILKEFLSCLPDTLIPSHQFEQFINLSSHNLSNHSGSRIITFDVERLLRMLSLVALNCASNKMVPQSLAVIFAPLITSCNDMQVYQNNMNITISKVAMLIDYYTVN